MSAREDFRLPVGCDGRLADERDGRGEAVADATASLAAIATRERIPGDQPQTWYFTFGVGQPNAGRFYKVEKATFAEARERMVANFGREWAFQYDGVDWHKHGVSQEERWGLREIK